MQHDVLDKVQTTVQPLMTNNHENFEKLLETVSDFQSTFEEQSTDDRQKLDDIRTAVLTRGRQNIEHRDLALNLWYSQFCGCGKSENRVQRSMAEIPQTAKYRGLRRGLAVSPHQSDRQFNKLKLYWINDMFIV